MARCKEQLFEVIDVVERKSKEAFEFLSSKSYEKALLDAERINDNHFFGLRVMRVSAPIDNDTRTPIVTISKEQLDEAVEAKMRQDEDIEMEERQRELDSAQNYSIDDMPVGDVVYDEFNYDNIISNKLMLKEKLERQRDLIKNKKTSQEQLEQVEYLSEVIRRLNSDLYNLQKADVSLVNYLSSVKKDIANVAILLQDATVDNIEAVNNYLEILELVTDKGPGGFLQISLDQIEEKDSAAHKMLAEIQGEISLLQNKAKSKTQDMIKNLIRHHIKQKDGVKDWEEIALDEEVDRLYKNQFAEEGKLSGILEGQVTMLDEQEERNILVSVLYKVYADAIARNNNKEKREKLSDMKAKVSARLKELGHVVGRGFTKVADQSIFLRKNSKTHQLIGKFSSSWVDFENTQRAVSKKISKLLYKPEKTEADLKAIQDQFDDINENADFLDVTRVPEIIEDPDFQHYSVSFMSEQEAADYKSKLVAKIGQREYNKLVQEQKEHLYSYQIFRNVREAKLREENNLDPDQDLQSNIPESDWNRHLENLYLKSPFIFAENYRNKGTNQITKPYYIKGEKQLAENSVDLEFISYSPKNEEFFDNDFKQIENDTDTTLYEAWSLMADLVEYNNNNGFNNRPDNLNEYSLSSQEKRVRNFGTRIINLLSPKTLNTIHKGITVSSYKDPDAVNNVAGARSTVDQEIENLYDAMIKKYKKTTKATRDRVMEEAKLIVMKRQDQDIIENILSSTELTEKFKAKREVESKLKFLKKQLDESTNRTEFKKITRFFLNKELYQINNRANWNGFGKDIHFGNWSKFYTAREKEVRKATKESKKELMKLYKQATTDDMRADIQKEIDSMDAFLDSGGQLVTPGSILEAIVVRVPRIAAFSLNFAAQLTNMQIAKINAWEVDGKLGYWDAGSYQAARSFARKFREYTGTKAEKAEIRVSDLLLQRLRLFQNSSNEIFKIEESKASSTLGAILENPMNFVSEVEKTIQRPQILALLTKIDVVGVDANGNPTTVPMFDADTGTFPAFSEANGKLTLREEFNTPQNRATFLENTSQEYANLFGDAGKVPKAIAYINGDYRNTSVYMFEQHALTAMMMLFKRWSVETIRKKFGVLKRLGENDQSGAATSAIVAKTAVYSLATGAIFGPVGMGVGLALYASYHGAKTVRREMKDQSNWAVGAMRALQNARFVPTRKGMVQAKRLAMAISAQSLSMVIDPLTKKQLINSDKLKKIMKVGEMKTKSGEDLSPKQIREIEDDLYFLTTSVAATLKFMALRYLVMMALHPDDEEEELHKKRVKKGDKFWSRLKDDPDTAMYYMLENILSGFIDDGNMLVNTDGLVRDGDIFGLAKFGTYADDIERTIKGDGDLKSGQDEGRNALWVHILKYNTPSMLKDGVSLGFGSKSKRDYETQNIIDNIGKSDFKKVNSARLAARRERKAELQEDPRYAKFTEKRKSRSINKILKREFRVIKKGHINSDGTIKKSAKNLYKDYYTDSWYSDLMPNWAQ